MNRFLPLVFLFTSHLLVLVGRRAPLALLLISEFKPKVDVWHISDACQWCQRCRVFTRQHMYHSPIATHKFSSPPRSCIGLQIICQAPAWHLQRHFILFLNDILHPPHGRFPAKSSVAGLSARSDSLQKWRARPSFDVQMQHQSLLNRSFRHEPCLQNSTFSDSWVFSHRGVPGTPLFLASGSPNLFVQAIGNGSCVVVSSRCPYRRTPFIYQREPLLTRER